MGLGIGFSSEPIVQGAYVGHVGDCPAQRQTIADNLRILPLQTSFTLGWEFTEINRENMDILFGIDPAHLKSLRCKNSRLFEERTRMDWDSRTRFGD